MRLDHLVVTCADLEAGTNWVEERLGLTVQEGGRHAFMGTHNRLLSLGPDEYLEVIAPDPAASHPGAPRWFALDRRSAPALTNWMVRTGDLDAALAAMPAGIGTPYDAARGDLRWRVALQADGELPFGGACPGLLQWQGPHPAPALRDVGCRLAALRVTTPHAEALSAALRLDDARVEIAEGPLSIGAEFDTPEGRRAL